MRIILSDLKELIQKKAVFLFMILGIIAGAFALIVYYSSSASDLKSTDIAFGVERTMEFRCFENVNGGDVLYSIIKEEKIPSVSYAAALCYDKEEYDIVAVYFKGDIHPDTYKGSFIDNQDIGKKHIVISKGYDLSADIGDTYRISGIPFEITGIIDPSLFIIESYDYRRIEAGEEYIAGIELARDENFENRPQNYMIIPIDMMDEINLSPSYYHITFENDITEKQREEISETIVSAFGTDAIEFTDITPYSQVHSSVKYAKLLVYAAALVMGIINIITVFGLLIKSNKKTYVTYKMLGATNFKIGLILYIELFIISLAAYLIALVLAWLFIRYSGFITNYVSIPLGDNLLIFLSFYAVAALLSIKPIKEICGKSVLSLHRNITAKSENGGDISVSNRKLYLLALRYNKSTLKGVISVALLSFICIFTFSFACTYVAEGKFYSRYLQKISDKKIGMVMYKDSSEYIDSLLTYTDNPSDTAAEDFLRDCDKKVESLPGVTDFVNYTHAYTVRERKHGKYFDNFAAMNGFWENIHYPLKEGSWERLETYDINSTDPVPVVINESLAEEYPIGTLALWEVVTDFDDYEENGEFFHPQYYTEREFEVVGVLDDNARVLTCFAPYQDFVKINFYFETLPHMVETRGDLVMSPQYKVNGVFGFHYGEHDNYERGYGADLIFSDSDMAQNLGSWNNEISDFAKIDPFDNCVARYEEAYTAAGGNMYFMHAFITGILLVFGVGGCSIISFFSLKKQFGIYYMCGMPWNTAVKIMLCGSALDMLIPGFFGAVMGAFTSDKLRTFSFDTKLIATLCGIGGILVIYTAVSLLVVFYMNKKTPKSLISEDKQ